MFSLGGTILRYGWAATATAIAPALTWHLNSRVRQGKELAQRLPERRGVDPTPRPAGTLVWLHAASVGETMSVLPVLSELANHGHVLMTTGTVTSAALLAQRLPGLAQHGRVMHRFAPLDVPSWVARFLDHWQPDAAVFVESELWPNQLRACRVRGIPMMLLNGRMSEGSFRSWSRARSFAREVLGGFAQVWARGEEDAARIKALRDGPVESRGDLKFAAPPLPCDDAALQVLRDQIGDRPVWLAASTHAGEEAAIAGLHRSLAGRHPGLLTIIVPRHPDRGTVLSVELGIPRRSANAGPDGGLWLADTLGEMGLWYRLAHVVFVGRSLLPPGGGQNPLEPARLGRPVIVGPHTGNFAEHVALLHHAKAICRVHTTQDLGAAVSNLLADRSLARAMGGRARAVAERHGDLPRLAADAILRLAKRTR